jgi:hypothetical protein
MPPVEVRDISIQPETNDLLIASHGRGIYIIDDLTPFRNIIPELLNSDAAFLPTRQNYVYGGFLGGFYPNEAGFYIGENATEDAVITYYLKDRVVTGDVKLEIYDQSGRLIKSVPGTKRKGINRITWDMHYKPPKVATAVTPDQSGFIAPFVNAGIYPMKLIAGNKTIEGSLDLKVHPMTTHSADDMALQNETSLRLYRMQEDLAFMVENILKVQSEAKKLLEDKKIEESSAKSLLDKLEELRKTLVATKEGQMTGEEQLRERLGWLYVTVTWYNGRPTEQQINRISGLEKEMNDAMKNAEDIYRNYLSKLNSELKSKGLNEILLMTRDEFDKKDSSKIQQDKTPELF